MRIKRKYKYSDTDMLAAAHVVTGNFIECVDELSYINLNYTTEYARDLESRVVKIMDDYLGENFRYRLVHATDDVKKMMQKSIRMLGIAKAHIEEYCSDKVKKLTKLGYEEFWKSAERMEDQNSTMALLTVFERNINDYKNEMLESGLNPVIIDETLKLKIELGKANSMQEELKFSTVEMKNKKIKVLNDIYDEVISICKMAQKYYIDDSLKTSMFSFRQVVIRANGGERKYENTEDEEIVISDTKGDTEIAT